MVSVEVLEILKTAISKIELEENFTEYDGHELYGVELNTDNALKYINEQITNTKIKTGKLVKPKFSHNLSDTVSCWECSCGNRFKTTHKDGILDGTDIKFCSICGIEYNWSDDVNDSDF